MKYIITLLLVVFTVALNAQEVLKDGKTYDVKKDKIFLDGKDITETLSIEETGALFKPGENAFTADIPQKLQLNVKGAKKLIVGDGHQ